MTRSIFKRIGEQTREIEGIDADSLKLPSHAIRPAVALAFEAIIKGVEWEQNLETLREHLQHFDWSSVTWGLPSDSSAKTWFVTAVNLALGNLKDVAPGCISPIHNGYNLMWHVSEKALEDLGEPYSTNFFGRNGSLVRDPNIMVFLQMDGRVRSGFFYGTFDFGDCASMTEWLFIQYAGCGSCKIREKMAPHHPVLVLINRKPNNDGVSRYFLYDYNQDQFSSFSLAKEDVDGKTTVDICRDVSASSTPSWKVPKHSKANGGSRSPSPFLAQIPRRGFFLPCRGNRARTLWATMTLFAPETA